MKRAPVDLVNALRAVCNSAKLKNATRVAEAPRLVSERRVIPALPKILNVRKDSK